MIDKFQRIWAEVDLDAMRHNAENMMANLTQGRKMMAVIKADGYGHGAVPVAQELEPLEKIAGFAVATAEEGF